MYWENWRRQAGKLVSLHAFPSRSLGLAAEGMALAQAWRHGFSGRVLVPISGLVI